MRIELNNVEKLFNIGESHEVHALHAVNISIESGQIACLKGPSGSGKTTLLSIIGCIFGCTSGSTTIGGKNLSRLPDHFLTKYRREMTGFVHQQYNLIEDLSVIKNICLPLLPLGVTPAEQHQRAMPLLEKLQMAHRKDFYVHQLSGGEQQRVAIARALINDPPVFLADEPTAHLDHALSTEFMAVIEGLKKSGKTIVLSSHDPFVAEHPLIDVLFEVTDGTVNQSSCFNP